MVAASIPSFTLRISVSIGQIMSEETVRYDHAEIPHYTRIRDAAVTGIENR